MRRKLHVVKLCFRIIRCSLVIQFVDKQLVFTVLQRCSIRLQKSYVRKAKRSLSTIFVFVGTAMFECEPQVAKLKLFDRQLDLKSREAIEAIEYEQVPTKIALLEMFRSISDDPRGNR